VLDPNQNSTFTDHYLGIPLDLSHVIFVATANQTDSIQPPLLDRMELLEILGYTSREKEEIAVKYLVPKQVKDNGLSEDILEFSQPALKRIIRKYTFEAGVRQL
jgi:ATP-dependent Lon protease